MSSPSTPTPEDPGSVSGAPNLSARFADTFISRFVDTGDVRLRAVVAGDGPPLLVAPYRDGAAAPQAAAVH